MSSPLDKFILAGTAIGDPIMGTNILLVNIGGGSTLSIEGVWDMVSTTNQAEEGGLMMEFDAKISTPSSASITPDLIGKTGTADGRTYRISMVNIGSVLTDVFVNDATEIL